MPASPAQFTDTAGPPKVESTLGPRAIIEVDHLQALFDALAHRDFQLIGPTVRDGAVVYDEIHSVDDLPAGWVDEQDGGTYRLKRSDSGALFGYTLSPQSWKRFLQPPVVRLWEATKEGQGFTVTEEPLPKEKRAFIGVRACELHAIQIQDRVFMGDMYVDPTYKARRDNLFILAVNCGRASSTCFCASVGSGPRAGAGFDLSLTEIVESGAHYFVVEAGSEQGLAVLAEVPHHEATIAEVDGAERLVEQASLQMGRTLDTTDIKEVLYRNLESPRWDAVAQRCLACANCTMVCPTCFCTTVEDVTDLTGAKAERVRKWDSCFTLDHSYIHGGSVRVTPKSRYRQWMTHKLGYWIDQFGTLGCVGCGRCITWCPVGIDITEELRAIRELDSAATTGADREAIHAAD
jgi:sulfhydrogenase subunit beta (sulfur reductase)